MVFLRVGWCVGPWNWPLVPTGLNRLKAIYLVGPVQGGSWRDEIKRIDWSNLAPHPLIVPSSAITPSPLIESILALAERIEVRKSNFLCYINSKAYTNNNSYKIATRCPSLNLNCESMWDRQNLPGKPVLETRAAQSPWPRHTYLEIELINWCPVFF